MRRPDPEDQADGVESWLAAGARDRFRQSAACFLIAATLAALSWAIPVVPTDVAAGFTGVAAGFFLNSLLSGSSLFEGFVMAVILTVLSVGLVNPIRIIMKHS